MRHYAEMVRDRSILRRLVAVSDEIATDALNAQGRLVNEILDVAESRIFQISEDNGKRRKDFQELGNLLAAVFRRVDDLYNRDNPSEITGVSTGFIDLDRMTSGLQPGDLIIVAARPSVGKTAFALNIGEHVAVHEKLPVAVFSMEMGAEQLTMRLIGSSGRIDQQRLRTGRLTEDDFMRLTESMRKMHDAPLYIDETPALNPLELRARARRLARQYGHLGLIIVDYLQLMSSAGGGRENRATEVAEISRSLKALAKELKCPVIALSQLSREVEKRQDKKPIMSDLRESGSIEQDADVIFFIHRDDRYDPDSANKGMAEIIIGKQRNGPIGSVMLTFLGQYTKFENFAPAALMSDHRQSGGALNGLQVLDLSRVLAGPWCTQILADLGAEVIKIERPGVGDDTRHWGPPFLQGRARATPRRRPPISPPPTATRSRSRSTWRSPRARRWCARWRRRATSLVENFKVGGLKAYGLDYDSLKALNPRLIYCSITGFGQTGPYAPRAGYDLLVQASSGMMSITGRPTTSPAAAACASASPSPTSSPASTPPPPSWPRCKRATRTGAGQHIDMALLDVGMAILANQASAFLNTGVAPQRQGNSHPSIVPYQDFPTADGAMLLAIGNDGQFARFCEAAGQPEWAERSALQPQHAARGEPRDADPDDGGGHPHPHHRRVDRAARANGRALRPDQRHRAGVRRPAGQGARPGAASQPTAPGSEVPADPRRREPAAAVGDIRRCCATRRPRSGEHTDEVLAELGVDAAAARGAAHGGRGLRSGSGGAARRDPVVLQHVGREVREPRALAALQGHVAGVGPALEALDDVGQARRPLGEVGRVDLRDVAQADDLAADAGPGHERLHLLGREVLRLVDDQVLVDEGAPAHERHRLHPDPRPDQVGCGGASPFAAPPALPWFSTSRLSSSAPIQGCIFSSSVPGR